MNIEENDTPPEFAHARTIMAKHMRSDPALRTGYVANVAMLLHDHFQGADFTDVGTRIKAAESVLSLVLESS